MLAIAIILNRLFVSSMPFLPLVSPIDLDLFRVWPWMALAPDDIVLGAEELRYAAQAVGKVSGLINVEDILDTVFKDFCIGK
jgi:hypothetical protein